MAGITLAAAGKPSLFVASGKGSPGAGRHRLTYAAQRRTLSCTGICCETDMNTITYTAVRAALADTMNRVVEDHEPVIITRSAKQQSVVMLSLDDYKAMEETAYLLRSPKNAMRLLESTTQLNAGRWQVRALLE